MTNKIKNDCFHWNVRLYPNAQMKKELDRLIAYDRFCWNEFVSRKLEYNKNKDYTHNLLEEYRPIRNASEWQLKLPQYVMNQVHRRFVGTCIQLSKYNKKVAAYNKTHKHKKKYKFLKLRSKKHHKKSFTIDAATISETSFQPKGKNFTFKIDLSKYSRVHRKYRTMEISELPPGLIPNFRYVSENASIRNQYPDKPYSRIVNAVILKEYDEYYVSFCLERLNLQKKSLGKGIVGIDPGLSPVMTLSSGRKYHLPKKIKELRKKARYYQSRMGKRRKKGILKQSNRYYRARTKYHNTLKRLAHIKDDWIHKITTQITKKYNEIHWEKCDSNRLSKNKRLSIHFREVDWYKISKTLDYKSKSRKGRLIYISPNKAATQTCSKCGFVRTGSLKLNLSDRYYDCPECGHHEDRDINAAKNIAKFT